MRKFATAFLLAAPLFQVASAAAQTTDLARLKEHIDSIAHRQPFDYSTYQTAAREARQLVYGLIAADKLRTATDFYTASLLAGDPSGFYEYRRVEHELALVALVLQHPDAIKRVSLSWDALNWSIGRGQRIGTFKRDTVLINMDPVPAPAAVRAVFMDLAGARARAASATTDAELQKLRDADQADREPPIDAAKQQLMARNDPPRRARVLEIVATGSLATGRDFHNAALVLQHGQSVDDFRLAHEMAMAAVALGDTSAVWLLSRTYDRLLLHLGHRQRMSTQFGGANGELLPADSSAVNDRIRRALGSRPSRP